MNHILFYDGACPAPYSSASLRLPGSKIGGAEATVVRIAERLAKTYRVTVGQHNRTSRESSEDGRLLWLTGKEASDSLLKPDVVVVQRRVGDLPTVCRHHPGARLFVWSHDWFDGVPGFSLSSLKWQAKVEARFFLHARYNAASVAVSQTHRENIRESLNHLRLLRFLRNRVRLEFVYNPIDDNIAPPANPAAYDPTKLIYFSAAWKGLDMVLATFAEVHRRFPDLKLHVASPGYHPIDPATTPATDNVVFLGSLSHENVLREVSTSLCVFYPADKVPETFGLVFAESNAVGTPVLAHPFGAAPELLTADQLVNAHDTSGIIRRLGEWKDGRRPVVRAKEELRMSNVVRSWERVLFSNDH